MWRSILLAFGCIFGWTIPVPAQVLKFAATGCGPYADDEEPLLEHYVDLVGGRVHDKAEWDTRLQQDADWVKEQIAAHCEEVRAAVVLAQARPTKEHELFFKQFTDACIQFKKPVLYLHADGHVWQVETKWRAPNMLRVQTDQVRLNPPVLVTVTEDANEPFQFDRRLDIASRRELFVDDYLIERLHNVSHKLHKPVAEQLAITCDAPWEGNTSAYFTLLADGDLYRMYYRASHFDEATKKSAHPEFTCYAESRDGIHWTKPKLGLVEFAGSKENNILLASSSLGTAEESNSGISTHNFTPMLDTNPACAADARFKALSGDGKGLKAFKSADGIHWSLMSDKAVITDGNFDSQNLALWHPGQKRYLAYHRKSNNKVRDIMVSTSTDFVKWSEPKFLNYADAPSEHLYTNAIRVYERAPHMLIGFPTRYQPKTEQVEPIFMTSRDGMNFKRWSEELIPITAPQNRDGNRSNYMTNALLQLPGKNGELSLYATEAYYAGPGSRVRRFSLRVDGFVSLHADEMVGEVVTKPFTFAGDNLHINYATAAGGQLRVELQDAAGAPLPGLSLADCKPLSGDSTDQVVKWKESVSQYRNKPVRLRFEMKQADLYSIKF